MQDDLLLFDYNVEERVSDFVAAALAQVISICLFV
jgi:alpha-mannosidase